MFHGGGVGALWQESISVSHPDWYDETRAALHRGQVFVAHRLQAGLTQETVADRAQLSVRTLRNIELGLVTRPRRHTLAALAGALGVEREEFETIIGPAPPTPVDALPEAPAYFVGREDSVVELERRLRKAGAGVPATVLVVGAAGTGKTALAVQVAHRLADAFPDGRLFLTFGRERPASSALARVLRMLGLAGDAIPTEPEEQLDVYRRLLAARRVLVVADNVGPGEARMLLPGPSPSALMMTSRSVLASLDDVPRVALPTLGIDDGVRLLATILGTDRVTAEHDEAVRIVRYCEGLPLALRIAGGRLKMHQYRSLAWLADRLSVRHRRLDELVVDDIGVRATLASTVAGLSRHTRRLLGALGQLDITHISAWVAAAAAGVPTADVEPLLDELAALHLAEPAGTPIGLQQRFTLHDLVHRYAAELGHAEIDPGERRAALRRVLGAALRRAEDAKRVANRHIAEHETPDVARWGPAATDEITAAGVDAWFEQERGTLVALTLQACDQGQLDHGYGLAYAMLDFFDTLRYDEDLLSTHQAVYEAAVRTGHPIAQAYAASGRAVLNANRGRYTEVEADMDLALRTFARFSSVVPKARVIQQCMLAHARKVGGAAAEALTLAQEAAALADELNDMRTAAVAQHSLGTCLAEVGEHQLATAALQRSLRLFEQVDAPVAMSLCLMRLGILHAALGDHATADAHLNRAWRLAQAHRILQSEPHLLLALADNALGAGASADAVRYLGACQTWLARHPDLVTITRMQLMYGQLCELDGSPAKAAVRYRLAQRYAVQAGAWALNDRAGDRLQALAVSA